MGEIFSSSRRFFSSFFLSVYFFLWCFFFPSFTEVDASLKKGSTRKATPKSHHSFSTCEPNSFYTPLDFNLYKRVIENPGNFFFPRPTIPTAVVEK